MKKRIAIIAAAVMMFVCVFALTACGEVYKVTLDYGYDNKTEAVEVTAGGPFTFPTPDREGYAFQGWFDSADNKAASVIKIAAEATYTAKWTRTGAVSVNYQLPEEAETSLPSESKYSGETVTLPAQPEIDGKQFVYWQNQFGQQFEAGETVTIGNEASYTFTAVYKNEVNYAYSVTQGQAPQGGALLEGDEIIVAEAPVVDGYTFRYWTYANKKYAPGDVVEAQAGSTGRMVFAAVYAKNVSIAFMLNGTEIMSIDAVEGDVITLPDCAVPNGSILKGWTLAGGGQSAIGAKFTVPATDTAFSAETAKAYLVTFYAEDNETIVDTQWVEEGTSAAAPQYQYPASDKWYITFTGLTSYDNITDYTKVYPKYEYIPSDSGLFEFTPVGDAYTVRYVNYAAGMGNTEITELKLPVEHEGRPVIGITANTSTSYNDTNIKRGGFALSNKLERLYIPSCYEYLANMAFAKNIALEEVVIGENSSLETINMYAFAGCSELKSIEIPNSVTYIGKQAFVLCQALSEVNFEKGGLAPLEFADEVFAVTTAAPKAAEYSSLTSFEFPARTTVIGARVFKYNMWLESLTFEYDGTAAPLTIKDNAFAATASGNPSTGIANAYPFAITEIEIPARTKFIGKGAFAFQIYVEKLTFAEGISLKVLQNYSFAHLISLESLELPEGITEIQEGAFARANGAYKFYTAEKPNTLTTAKSGEFGYDECNLDFALVIPDGVKTIGRNAFYQQFKIKSITFADSVETIGQNAFFCTVHLNTEVSAIALPYSLKELGSNFAGFTGVATLTVNCPYLKEFGGFSFSSGSNPAAMTIKFDDISSLETISKNSFSNANIKSITFGNYTPTAELSILSGCFSGSFSAASGVVSGATITTVKLPANLKELDTTAFKYLPSFTGFTVAEGNPYFQAEDGVLYYIGGGEKVLYNFPQGKTGEFAIPEGVTAVGKDSFKASFITGITFSASVKEIGAEAFYGSELTSVIIPDTVENVGNGAFTYTDVVTVICNAKKVGSAFSNCYSLQTAEFGENVEEVAAGFVSNLDPLVGSTWGTPAIVAIRIKGSTVKTMGSGTVINQTAKIYKVIFDSSDIASSYGASQGWSDIAETFTSPVTINMGGTEISIGSGGRIAPCQMPADDGTGFVWLTENYEEYQSSMTFSGNATLTKAYKVEIIENGNAKVLYVAPGKSIASYLPEVENKLYFDDNGEVFASDEAVNRSMILEAQAWVTVTFEGGGQSGANLQVQVIKGGTIPQNLIPADSETGYFWASAEGIEKAYAMIAATDDSTEFDFGAAVNGDITLKKLIYITFVDDSSSSLSGTLVKKMAIEVGSRIVKDNNVVISPSYTQKHNYVDADGTEVIPAPECYANRAWVTDNNNNAGTKLFDFNNARFDKATNIYVTMVTDISFTYEAGNVKYGWSIGAATSPKSVLQMVPDPGEGNAWINSRRVLWNFATQTCSSTTYGTAFTLADIAVVSFGNESTVKVISGEKIASADIPGGGIWCTVADGIPSVWDQTAVITGDITLYKYQRITFKYGEDNSKEYLIADGQALSAAQLAEVAGFIQEGYVWLDAAGTETEISESLKFTASATFTATEKVLVSVTFKDGLGAGSDKVIEGIVKGGKISQSDIPLDAQTGYVWVIVGGTQEEPTYTEFRSSMAIDSSIELVKKIKVTVNVSAEAAKDGNAVSAVYYYDIGEEAITLPELAENYGYVNASGKLLTADEIASLITDKTQTFTAVKTKTYIIITADGSEITKTVIDR